MLGRQVKQNANLEFAKNCDQALATQASPRFSHFNPSHSFPVLIVGLLLILLTSSGCQTFHPFAQKTRAKISSAREWANNGLEAFQTGRLNQAKRLFSKATQQDPNDFRSRANLARTLHQSGDRQLAIFEMQQAVEMSNGDPKMIIELGQMYLDAGQWIPARRQVELALDANHKSPEAWVLKGKTAKSKGDYPQALADFQRALGFAPDMTEVQLEIVDTYQRMGQPLRALSTVEQVLSRHPIGGQPEHAILAKSDALVALNQLSSAIALLQTTSERENASAAVFARLAQAQMMSGNMPQARLAIDRGKQSFPNQPIFDQLGTQIASQQQRIATLDKGNLR